MRNRADSQGHDERVTIAAFGSVRAPNRPHRPHRPGLHPAPAGSGWPDAGSGWPPADPRLPVPLPTGLSAFDDRGASRGGWGPVSLSEAQHFQAVRPVMVRPAHPRPPRSALAVRRVHRLSCLHLNVLTRTHPIALIRPSWCASLMAGRPSGRDKHEASRQWSTGPWHAAGLRLPRLGERTSSRAGLPRICVDSAKTQGSRNVPSARRQAWTHR